jgi:uncharacterized C2H2 Zn-finger protein
MHRCPHCGYRFEDAVSLTRHLGEGRGCPELDDVRLSHIPGMMGK